ncbi:MAG: large conductance mechanosensitive channel protein MscL [Oscillospiraceae bacterium]|nr:large conductance mechanosensitive channel protein MscL [Oscillospiraceae bacterium]
MKKFLGEFREFVFRGNVINLAVGIIIGAAFQSIVASLTENILSPIIGLFANTNFDTLSVSVAGAEIRYGAFITSVINFLIMAFVVFLLVKAVSRIARMGEKSGKDDKPAPRKCPYCETAIGDSATRCPACTSHLDEPGGE